MIDTHCHLTLSEQAIGEQVETANKAGIEYFLDAGLSVFDIEQRLNLLSPYPNVFMGAAIAPHEIGRFFKLANEENNNFAGNFLSLISGSSSKKANEAANSLNSWEEEIFQWNTQLPSFESIQKVILSKVAQLHETIERDRSERIASGKPQKIVAISEIGYEYYHFNSVTDRAQGFLFTEQVKLAERLNLPIFLHLRSDKGRNAYKNAAKLLKNFPKVKGCIHCFSGDLEAARYFLELDFYFSFSGIITFPRSTAEREVLRVVPASRLLLETDSPYLAPQPHRGKLNQPAWIVHVYEKVAFELGEDMRKLGRRVTSNASDLLSLPLISGGEH